MQNAYSNIRLGNNGRVVYIRKADIPKNRTDLKRFATQVISKKKNLPYGDIYKWIGTGRLNNGEAIYCIANSYLKHLKNTSSNNKSLINN